VVFELGKMKYTFYDTKQNKYAAVGGVASRVTVEWSDEPHQSLIFGNVVEAFLQFEKLPPDIKENVSVVRL